MQVRIGEIHGKPAILKLEEGIIYLDNEPLAMKNVGEDELKIFQAEVDAIPKSDNPGYTALVNACRASFIANLLGKCVADECVDKLTQILDHAHYEVQKFLGKAEDN